MNKPVEPIDDEFDERYRALCRRMHPAIAAILAHEDVTTFAGSIKTGWKAAS